MDSIICHLEDNVHKHNAVWRFPAENIECQLSDINAISIHYANILKKHNIKRGDRIGLILDNSKDYVCLLLAIWRLNAIAIPLRPKGGKQVCYEQYIRYCNEICEFNLIIYNNQNNEGKLNDIDLDLQTEVLPLHYFQESSRDVYNSIRFANENISEDDIAILQFSSGSTGDPKGVIVTHGMMMRQLQNILYNHIGSRRGKPIESLASWMPINHDMGLFIGVLAPVYTGCVHLLAPPSFYMRNPSRWFKFLSEYKVDMTFTTNSVLATTLRMLCRLHGNKAIDLSTLHLYIGAEKVSPIIVRKCYEILAPLNLKKEHVHIGYGMAENALGAACTRSNIITMNYFQFIGAEKLEKAVGENSHAIELVSLGTPDLHHEITIRNQQDNILPDLTLGEINIQSPCVTPGYYNNETITQQKILNGRLRTGDLGFYYQGELYYYSRIDDLIISGGRNIVPDDVESVVEELSFVRPTASCLISVDNNDTGLDQISLFVELKDNLSEEALNDYRIKIQSYVYETLDIYLQKILFCVKGTVEKTSSGKKRRKVVRQRFTEGNISLLERKNG